MRGRFFGQARCDRVGFVGVPEMQRRNSSHGRIAEGRVRRRVSLGVATEAKRRKGIEARVVGDIHAPGPELRRRVVSQHHRCGVPDDRVVFQIAVHVFCVFVGAFELQKKRIGAFA